MWEGTKKVTWQGQAMSLCAAKGMRSKPFWIAARFGHNSGNKRWLALAREAFIEFDKSFVPLGKFSLDPATCRVVTARWWERFELLAWAETASVLIDQLAGRD
jgi:hypothetical protein